jgi:biotin carboxylase
MPLTILCIASYEKGHEFLREAKRQGCHVILLTSLSLKETVQWPAEIDEIYYMPDRDKRWNRNDTIHSVAYLMRTRWIDRIVPLDDFDLEMAAALREHLRIPGLGESQTRFFRDKLAMRTQAQSCGLPIPDFTPILNYDRLHEYTAAVPAPWVLKPRLMAGAIGIKRVANTDELWGYLNALGDQQSYYLLERYVAGDIYHVDSIVNEGEILFAVASKYGRPPLDVSHGGGIFTTRLVERGSEEDKALLNLNEQVLKGFGLRRGVSHTEYIRSQDTGHFLFLETSARVGGAHIADLVEAATGINMWREWARLEASGEAYSLPESRKDYAGLLVSLARQEWPDLSVFNDPEVVWRMNRRHHVGIIVRCAGTGRVEELLDSYTDRVARDFHAAAPPRESPND